MVRWFPAQRGEGPVRRALSLRSLRLRVRYFPKSNPGYANGSIYFKPVVRVLFSFKRSLEDDSLITKAAALRKGGDYEEAHHVATWSSTRSGRLPKMGTDSASYAGHKPRGPRTLRGHLLYCIPSQMYLRSCK